MLGIAPGLHALLPVLAMPPIFVKIPAALWPSVHRISHSLRLATSRLPRVWAPTAYVPAMPPTFLEIGTALSFAMLGIAPGWHALLP
eukprot:10856581-Alexandrium_andersonii.AAC.1